MDAFCDAVSVWCDFIKEAFVVFVDKNNNERLIWSLSFLLKKEKYPLTPIMFQLAVSVYVFLLLWMSRLSHLSVV